MISQALLVLKMVLDIRQCSKPKPMPTCQARCVDLAIPSSFGASSVSNLHFSFLDSYNHPSGYDSRLQANNAISGATFSEFSMSSTRNFISREELGEMEWVSGEYVSIFSSCGYAFVWKTDSDSSSLDLKIPVNDVLEWPVANLSCDGVQKNASNFECRATNSEYLTVAYSSPRSGYRRRGSVRHEDDLCRIDGEIDGYVSHSLSLTSYYGLYCICLVSTVPAFVISWIISFSKKKKAVKLRQDLFVRNGGEILEAKQSVQKTLSVFTAEDLKKATNNYDESNVLLKEDYLGITYMGILRGVNPGVTIHRCYAFDRCKIEILISKLVALSQISHTNVVKLLGCCLETQVPLLVYEFITSKTLLDYINDNSLSWDIRLKVAADTAGALAYLHSVTTGPIIHGSLNSSCILLDHGYNVKVSGLALTCSECACVQFHGDTSIYLGPDCFSYGQFTEKSDVYSFGFILVELLTGKGVMSPEWLQIEEKLAEFFARSSGGGDLLGILDDRLVTGNNLGRLAQVAEIAKRCLSSSSQERPTMKEVAISLECVLIS